MSGKTRKIIKISLILLLVLPTIVLIVNTALSVELVEITGETGFKYSLYKEDKSNKNSGFVEFHIIPELLISTDNSLWSAKITPELHVDFADAIYEGYDLFDTPEKKRIFSLRELYVDFDFNQTSWPLYVKTGKQLFEWSNGIKFDFLDTNPFGARNQSESFLTLEDENRIGVWGALAKWDVVRNINIEFIINRHNNPIIAEDDNDMWTRDLPTGMEYGSMEIKEEISYGLRISGVHAILRKDIEWGVLFYHGNSNAIDHIDIKGNRVHPVLPEQYSFGTFAQTSVSGFNVRLGGLHYWLNNADSFMSWVFEVERFWEGVFREGDNMFLEFGYSSVWTTHQTETSMEEIDMRRVMKNHFATSIEYEPWEGLLFKFKALQRLDENEFYISPEAKWDISNLINLESGTIELGVRGEIIHDAASSEDLSFMNDLFTEHKGDDRVFVTLTYKF